MANKRTTLLKRTDELRKSAKVPFQVRKERKELESKLIDYEAEIADLEEQIESSKSEGDINFDNLINLIDDKAIAERHMKLTQELLDELYGSKGYAEDESLED